MGLRYYLIRRLLLIVPVLIGLSILTFVISHIVPGDPVRLAAGPQATAEQIHKLEEEFGLDKPLYMQYLNYMQGVLRGNLGQSMMNRHPVAMDLRRYFPAGIQDSGPLFYQYARLLAGHGLAVDSVYDPASVAHQWAL